MSHEDLFYEVEHPAGGGVVLGQASEERARELAQHYADKWQRPGRLVSLSFLHADDHHPFIPGTLTEIAVFQPRSPEIIEAEKPPPLTDEEVEEEERLNWLAIQKDALCEAIGRIVLERFNAFNKAADESRDPEELAVLDVFKWIKKDLPSEHAKMFTEETGFSFADDGASSDDIPL